MPAAPRYGNEREDPVHKDRLVNLMVVSGFVCGVGALAFLLAPVAHADDVPKKEWKVDAFLKGYGGAFRVIDPDNGNICYITTTSTPSISCVAK
jgi:hypothetical protein